ncbi:MAG: DUF885 domain-containing protein [Sphingomonadales bacterium]|nr:DUF885 domain-containing protein [Sphingomonadales bacterium]
MNAPLDRRRFLGASALAGTMALLPGCARTMVAGEVPAAALAYANPSPLDPIAEGLMRHYPEWATGLGIDGGARAPLKHRLTDLTPAGVAEQAASARARTATAKALLPGLTGQDALDAEVVIAAHELALGGWAFPYGDVALGSYRNSPYVVAQNVGQFLDVPSFLDSSHTVETADDAEAWLDRMRDYARNIDGETERLKHDRGLGVVAPDFLLSKTVDQLGIAQQGAPESWSIVTSLADKAKRISGDWATRASRIAEAEIAPALARQLAEIRLHAAQANGNAGVWDLPRGEEYYAWALRAGTTTTLSPDEVHRQGLDQLAELQGRMDTILKGEGYSKGSVGDRMAALGKDPKYLFPNTDAGRQQIIEFLSERIADIRGRMPQAFHTLVPGNAEVKRMAPEVEPGAPGAYGGSGSIDGKVPGRLWINLRTTEIWPRYALPDLAYHETIPGHVWQGEYTHKLPLVRSLLAFNAYSEGWALYGEQLADELGVYDANPVERLGYLQSLSFRACRLVVDTGIHAKRWTRSQAIDWFATNNGSSVEEVSGEVDRYCSWPGQACGYKVGHTTINTLRQKAKAELGERFDFRGFNDAVVLGGAVPMTVLGGVIDRYVAGQRG